MTPGWDLTDHVTHLADWAEEGARAVEVFERLGYWLSDPDEGIDAWNERMVAAPEAWGSRQTLDRYDRTRAAMLEAVGSPVHRRPPLARRLELGLRLPPRPRPQAPRDARPVEREPA